MTSPAPVGLTRPESVATSEIFAPTVDRGGRFGGEFGARFFDRVFSSSSRHLPSAVLLLASPEKWAIQW